MSTAASPTDGNSKTDSTERPRFVKTNGRGASGDEVTDTEIAGAFDVAIAALDRLGELLSLGTTRTAVLVFDETPLAITREPGGEVRAALGRKGEVPGALLAHLRRTEEGRERA